jgi:hypothetical protein
MTDVTQIHEEKNTFQVDVNIPGHDSRVSTPLFVKSRKHLIERDGGRCWACNCTAGETGHPIEAQRYGKEGYQFSAIEIIHHDEVA